MQDTEHNPEPPEPGFFSLKDRIQVPMEYVQDFTSRDPLQNLIVEDEEKKLLLENLYINMQERNKVKNETREEQGFPKVELITYQNFLKSTEFIERDIFEYKGKFYKANYPYSYTTKNSKDLFTHYGVKSGKIYWEIIKKQDLQSDSNSVEFFFINITQMKRENKEKENIENLSDLDSNQD